MEKKSHQYFLKQFQNMFQHFVRQPFVVKNLEPFEKEVFYLYIFLFCDIKSSKEKGMNSDIVILWRLDFHLSFISYKFVYQCWNILWYISKYSFEHFPKSFQRMFQYSEYLSKIAWIYSNSNGSITHIFSAFLYKSC